MKNILTIVFIVKIALVTSAPLGTVKMNETTYFDETEVSIGAWLSFITWVSEHQGLESAKQIMPDSSGVEPEVWKFITSKSNIYDKELVNSTGQPIGFFNKNCIEAKKFGKRLSSVSSSCSFTTLPITGVTYEQVIKFCEWRTLIAGENKYIFRLPSEAEWNSIASNCVRLHKPIFNKGDTLFQRQCPIFNFNIKSNCDSDSIFGKIISVGQLLPFDNGIYDIFGNVSEMLSENGNSKGGNFLLRAKQCQPDVIQYYTKPERWLGFRCIAIRNEK